MRFFHRNNMQFKKWYGNFEFSFKKMQKNEFFTYFFHCKVNFLGFVSCARIYLTEKYLKINNIITKKKKSVFLKNHDFSGFYLIDFLKISF